MTTDKIQFTKEKETMLMTLSSRAIQSQWKNPILRDPWAEEPKLELIKEYRTSELVAFSRFPLLARVLFRAQEVNPTLRRMERTIVYRYSGTMTVRRPPSYFSSASSAALMAPGSSGIVRVTTRDVSRTPLRAISSSCGSSCRR